MRCSCGVSGMRGLSCLRRPRSIIGTVAGLEYLPARTDSWLVRGCERTPAGVAAEERGRQGGRPPEPPVDPVEGPFGVLPPAGPGDGELLGAGGLQVRGGHAQQ